MSGSLLFHERGLCMGVRCFLVLKRTPPRTGQAQGCQGWGLLSLPSFTRMLPFGHQVNPMFCLWAVTHGLDLCDPLPTSLVEKEPGVGTNAHERELQNSQ